MIPLFDTGDRQDHDHPDMVNCSAFCTGHLVAGERCQCEVGPCP